MASSVSFIGSAGNPDSSGSLLKAEADFTVSGGQIVVTLTNNTPITISVAEVLTQISFSISGNKTVTAETAALQAAERRGHWSAEGKSDGHGSGSR